MILDKHASRIDQIHQDPLQKPDHIESKPEDEFSKDTYKRIYHYTSKLFGPGAKKDRCKNTRLRANELIKIGKFEQALESADVAVELDPACSGIRNTRAHVLFGLHRHDEAIKILK